MQSMHLLIRFDLMNMIEINQLYVPSSKLKGWTVIGQKSGLQWINIDYSYIDFAKRKQAYSFTWLWYPSGGMTDYI